MIAALCLATLACIASAALCCKARTERTRLCRALGQAEEGRDTAQRAARLASLELREAALRLQGQAAAPLSPAALAGLSQRFRTLADDLGLAGRSAEPPRLQEEPIDLLDCAREAAGTVAAAMVPGRRQFRIPSGEVRVWADRRAMRQVLGRVLTEAALNTGEGDWITLDMMRSADALLLEVADEGRGLGAVPGGATPAPCHGLRRDCRGIAAGLALARALMQAHGGRLDIIAAPGTGTRVTLVFPAYRRRGAGGASANLAAQPS